AMCEYVLRSATWSRTRPRSEVDRLRQPRAVMSPTTNFAMTLVLLVTACGIDTAAPPPDAGPPPTYSELYTRYFAPGTPGHCAKAGCHGDPAHTIWLCGTTPATCYAGMVSPDAGLINTAMPKQSLIADPVK